VISAEKRKVDASVATVLNEARMLGEIILLAVLQDEKTAFAEQASTKDDVGQLRYLRQSIWWVGKDKVELLATLRNILEDITANGQSRCVLQLVKELLDEAMMACIKLHTNDATATATDEFKRDAARSGEEVESRRCLGEIEIALQDIKEILLGKVRRRTCRETTRHLKVPAFVFAGDDSHD